MPDLLGQLLRFVHGEDFSEAQEARFQAHEREGNAGRLRLLLPLMAGAMTLSAFLSAPLGGLRAELPADQLLLRDAIAFVQAGSAVGAFGLWMLFRRGGERVRDALPMVASMGYFLHAAAIVGVDQLHSTKTTVYWGAAFGIALLASLSPGRVLLTYAVGAVAYTLAVTVMQSDPHLRDAVLQEGLGMTAACAAMAVLIVGARRRDFRQTLTIDEQQAELERLNRTLEERVAAQVEDLTRRAEEVERLNLQLQEQVRDRSRALTVALRRLASESVSGDALEGRTVGGRFSIGARIAAGGMGAVYEGLDSTTGERVAVKVIQTAGRIPVTFLERFLREAESAAMVTHPAVVRMLHVDIDDDGTFFQVQELVEGETLDARLARVGRLPTEEALGLLGVLAEALAAAHALGVVHRDIKPANLMLTRSAPGLKVLDFGISKVGRSGAGDDASTLFDESGVEPGDRHHTRAGAVMGTPRYMSPEQQSDASSVTDRADLFAFGVVAGAMLLEELPGTGALAAFGQLGLEEAVATRLGACLAERPGDRPSAEELAGILPRPGDLGDAASTIF